MGVEAVAELGDVQGLVFDVDRVECLVPGGQPLAGLGIEVGARVLVPDREVAAVEAHRVGGRPPHLVIGRRDHLAKLSARHRATDSDVDVRRETTLRLDRREVLSVVADQSGEGSG